MAETIRLCKMNLAVHGLSGQIREGNTYYEDLHKSTSNGKGGRFDFVMANPPFNVSGADKEKIKDDPRFPFGMPRADNANYLWIQIFYSALNSKGRAGFVIHNSAADSELEVRKRLIEENVVDVIITTSANLFYTVSLPCSLWFLDKARNQTPRKNYVLFIDAKEFFRQIDTVHREIGNDQIAELASIVRSFRGQPGYGEYKDRPGICKRVHISEIKDRNYSLNPKIYVEAKKKKPGHIQHAVEISEEISILQEEVDALNQALKKVLDFEVPIDRSILFDLAKLVFKRWFINFEAPNLHGSDYSNENLPPRWKSVRFRELLADYAGGGWGKDVSEEQHTEVVRIIRGTDMGNANMGEVSGCPVRYLKPSQLPSRLLRDGDIIIEVSGGGKEQPTGRTAYITEALINNSGEPIICASFCKLIRINPDILRPTIGFLHLQHIYDERTIERFEVQSTGIKNFKFEYFLDHERVIIPSSDIQDLFHHIVSNIFRLIHLLGKIRGHTCELVHVIPKIEGEVAGLANFKYRENREIHREYKRCGEKENR